MRKILGFSLLSVVFLTFFSIAPSAASIRAGTTCTRVGLKAISVGKTYTCIESSGKLLWGRGVVAKKRTSTTKARATLTSTRIPTPTLEPDPTPTVEPDPTPTVEPDPTPTVEPDPTPTLEPDWTKNFSIPTAEFVDIGSCNPIPGGREIVLRIKLSGGNFAMRNSSGEPIRVNSSIPIIVDYPLTQHFYESTVATSNSFSTFLSLKITRIPMNFEAFTKEATSSLPTKDMNFYVPAIISTHSLCQPGMAHGVSASINHYRLFLLTGSLSTLDLSAAMQHEVKIVKDWFAMQLDGRSPSFGFAVPKVTIIRDDKAMSFITNGMPHETDALVKVWRDQGTIKSDEVPIIYADTTGYACGWSAGDSSYVVFAMRECNIFPDTTSYFPYGSTYLLAHELTHSLGMYDHVQDSNQDVVYDGPSIRDWSNIVLDPSRTHYLNTGDPSKPNISDSNLLTFLVSTNLSP